MKPADTARRANAEGIAALNAGDGPGAVHAFTVAVTADPDAGSLWRNLAHAFRLCADDAGERGALK